MVVYFKGSEFEFQGSEFHLGNQGSFDCQSPVYLFNAIRLANENMYVVIECVNV